MPDAASADKPAGSAPGAGTQTPATQQQAPAASAGSGPAAGSVEAEVDHAVRYTLEELRAGARSLLGVSKHVVAGAFALEEDVKVTLEEARRQVAGFLKEEVTHIEGGHGGA